MRPANLDGISLDELPNGRPAVIVELDMSVELRRQMVALGILEGGEIRVLRRAPMGGAVLVSVGPARYALGPEVAAQIRVALG